MVNVEQLRIRMPEDVICKLIHLNKIKFFVIIWLDQLWWLVGRILPAGHHLVITGGKLAVPFNNSLNYFVLISFDKIKEFE